MQCTVAVASLTCISYRPVRVSVRDTASLPDYCNATLIVGATATGTKGIAAVHRTDEFPKLRQLPVFPSNPENWNFRRRVSIVVTTRCGVVCHVLVPILLLNLYFPLNYFGNMDIPKQRFVKTEALACLNGTTLLNDR